MTDFSDDIDARPFDRRLLRRLLALLRPQRLRVMCALGLSLVSAAMELSAPLLLKWGIDAALVPGAADGGDSAAAITMLALVCSAMALVACGQLLSAASTSWLVQRAGQEVLHDLRRSLLRHLLTLPMAGLLRQPVGRLLTRTVYDPATINEFLGAVVVQLTRDVLMIIGCAALLLYLDWRIFVVVMATFPMLIVVTILFRSRARQNWRAIRAAVSRLTARLAETLSGLDDIQLARIEQRQAQAYALDNSDDYQSNMRQVHIFAVFQPSFHVISVLAIVAALLAGGMALDLGATSLGAVIAAIGVVELMFRPVRDMAEKYNVLQAALASAERVAEVLDSAAEDAAGSAAIPEDPGIIRFENVWFRYPPAPSAMGEESTPWVLQDLSFTLAVGGGVALVGASGSGKSTVVALLLRLYQPQRGRITCDGVDIADFPLVAWRRRLGLVLQESALMAGTVADNCRAGIDDIDPGQWQEVVELTGLNRLPGGGLQRMLGEGGRGLSAGERQLVALGRALLTQPALLILDEATAHVDSQAEAAIQEAVARGSEHWALLVIAHRLATVRDCREILLLDGGCCVERGSYHDLIAADGRFAALERLHRGEAWAS